MCFAALVLFYNVGFCHRSCFFSFHTRCTNLFSSIILWKKKKSKFNSGISGKGIVFNLILRHLFSIPCSMLIWFNMYLMFSGGIISILSSRKKTNSYDTSWNTAAKTIGSICPKLQLIVLRFCTYLGGGSNKILYHFACCSFFTSGTLQTYIYI